MGSLRGRMQLLLLLVLSLLAPQAQSYCPEHYPPKTCFQLYSKFEDAMLQSPENLYNLREEYYPSSHSPPIYGHVNYTIIIQESANETQATQCESYNRKESTAINLNGSQYPFIWSDSGLLAKISPFTLSFYQLEILNLVYGEVEIITYRFYPYPPKPVYLTLDLTLTVDSLPCTPSEDQLIASLKDLTSWLKVYAKGQGNITPTWDINNKGYGVYKQYLDNGRVESILYATMIMLVALITTVLWSVSPHVYKEVAYACSRRDSETWCVLFWGAAIAATLCNTAAIVTETVVLMYDWDFHHSKWPASSVSNWDAWYGITKLAIITMFFVTDIIAAMYTVLKQGRGTTLPVPKLLKELADHCCCCFYCGQVTSTLKFIQILAVWNLLLFAHFVSIAVLPTTLWIFVLPIRVTWMVVLVFAALFLLVLFMGTIFSINQLVRPTPAQNRNIEQGREAQLRPANRNRLSMIVQILIAALLIATVSLLVVLYLDLVTTEITTNTPTEVLTKFLPTGLVTVLGWFVSTRLGRLFARTREREDDDKMLPV